ncbi:L,D-transpeptidase [Pseudonocardia sp.]|uniref:L,D-transpeptidase n=1 Tax=Pseudonocardia sp. TaxID=60912 RepID=UPI003D0D39F2
MALVALGTVVAVGAAAAPMTGPVVSEPVTAEPMTTEPMTTEPVVAASAATAPAVAVPDAAPAPAAVPAPVPAVVAGTPCSPAARACADLSSNQAWLIRDGKIEYGPTKIVHGKSGYRTPAGTFRVFFKSRNHVSSIYDVAMPNAVFFNGNIAFHQGPLRGGSHGCVRLSKSASQVFFATLQRGDVVQIVR